VDVRLLDVAFQAAVGEPDEFVDNVGVSL